jgi:hypothetical protein
MNIQIIIKKGINKSSIITIFREDGSSTWSKLHRGLETHDIAHFAVESTLSFKNAFYGLINQGFTIEDFAAPKHIRPESVKPENLLPEAIITEHIVNLLEVELLNSGLNYSFLEDLSTILKNNNLICPKLLNTKTLKEIRYIYHNLFNKWSVLNEGEELQFNFSK